MGGEKQGVLFPRSPVLTPVGFDLKICMCIRIHVSVHMWGAFACKYMHTRACKPEVNLRRHSTGVSTLLLRTRSLTGLECIKKLGWWIRNPEGSACLCLSSSGLLNHHVFVGFFKQGFWCWTWVLILAWQALYWLNHSLSPQCIQYNMEEWKTNKQQCGEAEQKANIYFMALVREGMDIFSKLIF